MSEPTWTLVVEAKGNDDLRVWFENLMVKQKHDWETYLDGLTSFALFLIIFL